MGPQSPDALRVGPPGAGSWGNGSRVGQLGDDVCWVPACSKGFLELQVQGHFWNRGPQNKTCTAGPSAKPCIRMVQLTVGEKKVSPPPPPRKGLEAHPCLSDPEPLQEGPLYRKQAQTALFTQLTPAPPPNAHFNVTSSWKLALAPQVSL